MFFRNIKNDDRNKRFFYRFFRRGKDIASAWYERHVKSLRIAGFGGKTHTLEKGHVNWNRKGRW